MFGGSMTLSRRLLYEYWDMEERLPYLDRAFADEPIRGDWPGPEDSSGQIYAIEEDE